MYFSKYFEFPLICCDFIFINDLINTEITLYMYTTPASQAQNRETNYPERARSIDNGDGLTYIDRWANGVVCVYAKFTGAI